MLSDSKLTKIDPADPAYLLYSKGNELPDVVALTVGASVFVGAGSNCKIQVKDDSVQQLHCMFMLEENKILKLQDWNTGTTFLNGKVVSEEMVVRSGDQVTVGNYCLTAVLDAEYHQKMAGDALGGILDSSEDQSQDVSAPAKAENSKSEQADLVSEFSDGTDAIADVRGEQSKRAEFKYDFDADLKEQDSFQLNARESHPSDMQFSVGANAKGDDAPESLLLEVEQLRFELADRDAEIMALKNGGAGVSQTATMDDENALKLVTRLEDLLDELKLSDDRVQGLEELLRASEDAAAAERDERSQMEKWITEIEKRVSQRESESLAEIEGLESQLKIARSDADVIHSQLQSLSVARDDSTKQDAAVTMLNKQVEGLRISLQQANEENRKLLERPVQSEDEIDVRARLLEKEDELAKVRLEASRERAEMARRLAKLENIRDDLEMRLQQTPRNVDKGDSRIQAMREHLKEIHAEEQAAKAEKKSNSLSGRIANLLARVR